MENEFINSPLGELNPKFDFARLTPEKIAEHVEKIIRGGNEISDELQARIITSNEESTINYLFEKNGIGCFSRSSIIVIKGKPKCGKTKFLIGLIIAVQKGERLGFKIKQKGRSVIIYVDTEQSRAKTSEIKAKIDSLSGTSDNGSSFLFIVINICADSPYERRKYILEVLKIFNPDALFIDGIKDLIDSLDVNDARKCGEVIEFLMQISQKYNLALVTTIHENKGNDYLRGHLGSELLNKCSECWQVRKSGGIFQVEQTETRNQPVSGLNFQLNEDILPVLIDIPSKFPMTEEKPENKFREAFLKCLPEGAMVKYCELKTKYATETKLSLKTAEKHIKKAVEDGIIKNNDGIYEFNYPKEILLPIPSTLTPTL
jgi:hypothetical protein